jgi:hypothetical protein
MRISGDAFSRCEKHILHLPCYICHVATPAAAADGGPHYLPDRHRTTSAIAIARFAQLCKSGDCPIAINRSAQNPAQCFVSGQSRVRAITRHHRITAARPERAATVLHHLGTTAGGRSAARTSAIPLAAADAHPHGLANCPELQPIGQLSPK